MKGDKKGRNTGLRTVIAPGTRAWDMIKDQNIICTGVQETGTKGIFFAGKKGHNKDTMVIPNVDGSSGSIRPRANDLPQSTNTVPGEGVKLKKNCQRMIDMYKMYYGTCKCSIGAPPQTKLWNMQWKKMGTRLEIQTEVHKV